MISVIIPCHNVERYIAEALDSVLAQDYAGDMEIVVVEDGSDDTTPAILAKYATLDSRVKIVSQENLGVAAARAVGIAESRGDLIAFLDSDDICAKNYLSTLEEALKSAKADIAVGAFATFSDISEIPFDADKVGNKDTSLRHISGFEAVEESLYQRPGKGVDCSLWGKLFRRELWQGVEFHRGEVYEDLDVFYRLGLNARSGVAVSDRVVYYYRKHRRGSILNVFNSGRLSVLDVTRRLCAYVETNEPGLLPAACDRRLSAAFNMLGLMLASLDGEKKHVDKISECLVIIKSLRIKSLFNLKVRSKNRLGILLSYLPRPIFLTLLRRQYRRG